MQFVTEKIAVEVKLRPITPHNIVKQPRIILRTNTGKEVQRLMMPKVLMGVNQQDGRQVLGYPKMECPKCLGEGTYTNVVVTNKQNPEETYTMSQSLYQIQIPRFPKSEWNIEEQDKEQECDLCHGTGSLKYFTNYDRMLMAEGEVVNSEDIVPCQMKEDGSVEPFPYYDRSENLSVQMEIPKPKATEYYFDGGWAELDSPTKTKTVKGEKIKIHNREVEKLLWKEAERYIAQNIIGIGRFVKAKSHREWFFVAMPVLNDKNEFGWLIGYTTCKKVQKCLMSIPADTKIAEDQKIPTKTFLDMEAFVK